MARQGSDLYGWSANHPARPQTDLACLVVNDLTGQFNNAALEFHISIQKSMKLDLNINEKQAKIGFTALHWAATCGNVEGAKILVKNGANVHVKDVLGFTPLFYCTGQVPSIEMTKFLVEDCKASVNEKSHTCVTCLHGAALKGNKEIVKLLLKHGADPRFADEEGTTPFDLARLHKDVLAILHKANSKVDLSRDKEGEHCANCDKSSLDLKCCSRCKVTYYCSKECQREHWKKGNHKAVCEEGVLAEPARFPGYRVGLMNVLQSQKPRVAFFGGEAKEYHASQSPPKTKRFVVKVQRPIDSSHSGNIPCKDLMVYNVDRSVDMFIKEETPGYKNVLRRILDEGMYGLKAYFWAERVSGKNDMVKVFPGRLAPAQEW